MPPPWLGPAGAAEGAERGGGAAVERGQAREQANDVLAAAACLLRVAMWLRFRLAAATKKGVWGAKICRCQPEPQPLSETQQAAASR